MEFPSTNMLMASGLNVCKRGLEDSLLLLPPFMFFKKVRVAYTVLSSPQAVRWNFSLIWQGSSYGSTIK